MENTKYGRTTTGHGRRHSAGIQKHSFYVKHLSIFTGKDIFKHIIKPMGNSFQISRLQR